MWKEEEQGRQRVNHARVNQLLRVLPSQPGGAASPAAGSSPDGQTRMIASSCPFCMTMLTDGLRDQGHDDVQELDVAEILLRAVKGVPTPVATQA
jgi:Fe-S oxidoreductase